MKILRIIASADPKGGGPIEGLKLSSGYLQLFGHETEVATLDDPASQHVAEFPFRVYACGPSTKRYGYSSKLATWIANNAQNYDVAVIHGLWNHASVGGWQGLRKAGLPYLVFTHGMLDPWFKQAYPFKHWAKQIFWLLWQGKVLRDAKNVLFTSEEERKLAKNVFWGFSYEDRVVAYGSSEPSGEDQKQKAAFFRIMPELKGKKYLLFLSRIHPKKGCDLLVEAFANQASLHKDVDLVIAGPDQQGWASELKEQFLKAGIADRVHWPGMLTGHAKWGAFRGAEAFVLPSHQENFGIVVAEAMACGTPVLTTRKVNIWREVESSGAGLVEEDTQEGINRLFEKWLSLDDQTKSVFCHKAREGFQNHFHPEAAAKDLESALYECMRGKNVST